MGNQALNDESLTSNSAMKQIKVGFYLVWKLGVFVVSPYFPAFGLNTERYAVFFQNESEWGKVLTGKAPNADSFHAL